jgi:hypothetical protein
VSNAEVQFEVQGPSDSTNKNGALAICTAASGAGSFTIPPYVLLALPASNAGGLVFGQQTEAVALTAAGLDLGVIRAANLSTFIGNFPLE